MQSVSDVRISMSRAERKARVIRMKIKPLVIGDLMARIPVMQGGMGVGVSLSGLAGAVAREGGAGTISAAQIGFMEEDFDENPLKANLRAMKKELDQGRN